MEVHQLRYFCAVARHGSFTRAAEAEHIAQPSLSQQILKLEDELGAHLFDRLPKSVRLTQFGSAFLVRAQEILRQLGEAKIEIQEMAGTEKGEVTIGVIPTIAPYFLPGALASFARQHSGIVISVVEDITPVLLQRLNMGAIDLALLALPVPGHDLISLELMREPLYAVFPEKHPLARRKSISFPEFKNEPFLLLKEGHCFRENALAACRRSRVVPNVVFESGQFSTILAMVASGMGVSVVPAMAAQPGNRCSFVRIEDKRSFRSIGVVRTKHHFPTRAVLALMGHFESNAAK
jgi:LysR family transcriptional regulator, hydrogen peroxide-inducible genes activator